MIDVWEPWVPELGQRVRVRLSGECSGAPHNAPDWKRHLIGHEQQVDGTTGTMVEVFGYPWNGHRFTVELDQPIASTRPEHASVAVTHSVYAAIELEPETYPNDIDRRSHAR